MIAVGSSFRESIVERAVTPKPYKILAKSYNGALVRTKGISLMLKTTTP